MTKMTKAQLVDENIALRHSLSLLEAKVARLEAEHKEFNDYAPVRTTHAECIVSTYTKRDGSCWNKVRIGHNRFAHRPAN